jgi:hypothetical protein
MADNKAYELKEEERTRCEIWTRVMGYHRPVAAWNPGKRAEHRERRYYLEPGPDSVTESSGVAQRKTA